MEVQAHLRNLRMSPRKVRLVIDLVRGKSVNVAVTQLSFLQKEAARPVLKLLQSAMANASHNHQLDASGLRIKAITANSGPTLKRFRPRAHGSAAPIRKRTTHLTLVLTDEPAPATPAKAKPKARARRRSVAMASAPVAAPAPEAPAAVASPSDDTPSTN